MVDVYSEGLGNSRLQPLIMRVDNEHHGCNSEHRTVLGGMTETNLWLTHMPGPGRGGRKSKLFGLADSRPWGKKDFYHDLCPRVSTISAKLFPASLRLNSGLEAALCHQ